jgi:ribosomal protein L12E/L44/L45/RPP1/RPP2
MATWEHSVILLQSDTKEQSIEALEYAIKHSNSISNDKTKIVHLTLKDLEGQDMPEVVEKKGKKGKGKPSQSANFSAMLQHWIKNDEIEGIKKKKKKLQQQQQQQQKIKEKINRMTITTIKKH